MFSEIAKAYDPKLVEEKWYTYWETNQLFHAKPNPDKKPYSIVIPPPNVTGILHMGHALNNTIQDILIRYKKLNGFEALWMPGTDHAGIATQNVVEKKIAEENLKRDDLGREKFLERVWEWKEEYGSTIIKQLKKLGSSCDWERTRFTMDDEYSKAVKEVFVSLWNKGLIYQGDKVINWCPRCQTALSDEEAPRRELQGNLYYIKYPLKTVVSRSSLVDSKNKTKDQRLTTNDYIVVATTRPETMLGDTAVAVNPKDKHYKHLVGQTLILPLINREIKIIADAMVDMEFGTGAVKVTPAHDPNDDAMARKHELDYVNIMHPDARLNENAGDYKGMDRFEARQVILEDLKERKQLEKVEPHILAAGHCYRCHTIIEPYLSKQWFVTGRIKFHPNRWSKVYLNWMENIQDWCISRQIWWGHRIPVWYCKSCQSTVKTSNEIASSSRRLRRRTPRNDGVFASLSDLSKCPTCNGSDLYQDGDVLDTWFSSWLWPFATFYWPFETVVSRSSLVVSKKEQQKKDLDYFYPTSCLVTAQEIIFFWVARMIMAGFEFMKAIPFSDVYIHGTVRDDTGKKMSKSLGNIIDPLEIINEFGSDALRFSIISLTSVGQDVFLSKQKFELGRNFANKIWNGSRFIITNLKPEDVNVDLCVFSTSPEMNIADKWILSRFYQMLEKVEDSISKYRFNDAASSFYEFFWHEFCDWYIEFSKPQISEKHTQVILYKILEKSLRVLHPFMPFITEEIWHTVEGLVHGDEKDKGQGATNSIMTQKWPHLQKQLINKKIDSEMQVLIDAIVAIRNIRSSWTISPSIKFDIIIKAKKRDACIFTANLVYIKNLARVEGIEIDEKAKKPPKSAVAIVKGVEIYCPLEKYIDIKGEQERLKKKIEEINGFISIANKKLKNENFLKKAPANIVEMQKAKKAEHAETLKRLKEHLKDLG